MLACDYNAAPYRVRMGSDGDLVPLDPKTLGKMIRNDVASRKIRALASRQRRGRCPQEPKEKTFFTVGLQVEKEIPEAFKQDRHSIVAARRLVSNRTRLEFDVVAQYHKRFRKFCIETGIEIPS